MQQLSPIYDTYEVSVWTLLVSQKRTLVWHTNSSVPKNSQRYRTTKKRSKNEKCDVFSPTSNAVCRYRVSNKKSYSSFWLVFKNACAKLIQTYHGHSLKDGKNHSHKSLGVLPHLECVWLKRLHFCCFHWTRRSLHKKFSWEHPKTRLDFEKCPEQKDKSLGTPFARNYDRNRLWGVRQGCQPPPFGGPWACPRWSAGSGPTSSVFFKSLLHVTHKMFMLITYITCFAIYLATQQCIHFYFWGNVSSVMTENNSSRFFLDAWHVWGQTEDITIKFWKSLLCLLLQPDFLNREGFQFPTVTKPLTFIATPRGQCLWHTL